MARTVGDNIAAIREDQGLTQTMLADKLGVRQPTAAKYEKQKGLPKLETLMRIAVVLKAPVEDLLEGVDEEYQRARDLLRQSQGINLQHGPKETPHNDAAARSLEGNIVALRTIEDTLTSVIKILGDAKLAAKGALAGKPGRIAGSRRRRGSTGRR